MGCRGRAAPVWGGDAGRAPGDSALGPAGVGLLVMPEGGGSRSWGWSGCGPAVGLGAANCFPAKEAPAFDGDDESERSLVGAVTGRAPDLAVPES